MSAVILSESIVYFPLEEIAKVGKPVEVQVTFAKIKGSKSLVWVQLHSLVLNGHGSSFAKAKFIEQKSKPEIIAVEVITASLKSTYEELFIYAWGVLTNASS